MNDAPRQKLREIIEKHGRLIIENPRRCENLLHDYCGGFRREISVLMMALKEHAVADMLTRSVSQPRQVLLARLAQRLCDNLALSAAAARWSIESWAIALGVISEAELKANETERREEQSKFQEAENISQQISAQTTQTARNSQHNQILTTGQLHSTQIAQVTPSKSVLVVSSIGGNFTGIGEALRSAPPNSRILVREGLYNEHIVLDKNVEIVGDGAVENIIVRSQNQSCLSMQTDKAAVRGLTLEGRGKSYNKSFFAVDIPGGSLVLENCRISSDSLSCLAIHDASANPLIRNCRIHDGADSGIYIFDNARARIENCDIYRNTNDNIAITQGANPTVKNCRIFEGENGGVVIWGNGATGTIEDCEIFGHRLANVGVSRYANPVFRRCKIFGGRDPGVLVQQNGYGTFEECSIYENGKAEVAITDGSNTILRRSIVCKGNESGVYVGNKARALVEGCDIYDNDDAGVAIYGESVVAVRRCNINRNGKVAVRIKENSAASVEDCDLRGNRIAAWETEHGIVVERKNNRE